MQEHLRGLWKLRHSGALQQCSALFSLHSREDSYTEPVPANIREYVLIGDLHTAALVSDRGSIDWLCMPAFDSPSVFAAVLDERKGGRFAVMSDGYETESRYLPNTAIVETIFTGKRSKFRVRDFMLPRETEEVVAHYLTRRITGMDGTSTVTFHLDIRPRYAKQTVSFRKRGERLYVSRHGERSYWLHVPQGSRVRRINGGTVLEITLTVSSEETKEIILEYSFESRLRFQNRDLEAETAYFWRTWVAKGKYFAPHRDGLIRSAITLKLMQFYPTGGLIAAPTASLPETIGGERNWDYRYVWLRDASFTLYAFSVLGYKEEAKKFFHFIEEIAEEIRSCEGDHCDARVAVMYTIWGQHLQREETLGHLAGHRNSKPVRIGNGASGQHQLDIFGSLIDAYYFMWERQGLPISKRGCDIVKLLVRKIEEEWQHADSGIWEVRGFTEQFTYGKVMAWVGVDRAIKLADVLGVSPRKRKEWEALRARIERWVWKNCFDKKKETFMQYPKAKHQDATNLLFVLLHFLDGKEDIARRIVERTRDELSYRDLYMYRYHAKDGLTGEEGAFVLCTYWMIAALAATNQLSEAQTIFRKFNKLVPQHGLMAEEIDPVSGAYLGNHPQAFSHIGYIMGAYYLHVYGKKAKEEKRQQMEEGVMHDVRDENATHRKAKAAKKTRR